MFQNKFEIKIFEWRRYYPRCKTMSKKTCSAVPDVSRTGLTWNKPN